METHVRDRTEWFRNAGFGMFLHWGVYSVIGRGEWVKFQEQIPDDEYWSHAPRFRAQNYDPNDWARVAKAAGMRYMVLGAKHHDGYCLFKTCTTPRNSLELGPKRDLIADYADACRRHGLRVGFYYSLPDWSQPAFFDGPDRNPTGWGALVEYLHTQVRELMTQYGKVDVLWYDNILAQSGDRPLTAADYRSTELNCMVRQHQPHILINDRSLLPEDFYTAEQHARAPESADRLWEACMTMNKHWGYFPADPIWKSPTEIVNVLTGCAASQGNFLLNVGPKPDGTFPARCVRALTQVGAWLERNGEAIYGVSRSSFPTGTAGCAAERGKTIYVFVHWWPGRVLALPRVDFEIKSARILGSPQPVVLERQGRRLILKNLPNRAPDRLTTVIALERT